MMSAAAVSAVAVRRDLARLVGSVAAAREHLRALRTSSVAPGTDEDRAHEDPVVDWLYTTWYTAVPERLVVDPSAHHRPDLAMVLRAALPASVRWATGWVVLDVGRHGTCVAGRRGHARQVRAGEYANLSRPGVPVRPGDAVAISECIDWVDGDSGFWATRSVQGEPSPPWLRVYWSVSVRDIARVLTDVTTTLERLNLRYSLKCPVRSAAFGRVDALIVYLERADWIGARDAITVLARDLEPRLRPWCPPLTLRLAHGVACADDPGGGLSFGQSRCRMLAVAVHALVDQPTASADAGIEVCLRALSDARVDPERPWLHAEG
ncbi:MAG: T3SS effector HopA1 family protein [Luteitalea sp.]